MPSDLVLLSVCRLTWCYCLCAVYLVLLFVCLQIREWAYSRANPYTRPDLVTAQPLNWGVPTVQRLWFG